MGAIVVDVEQDADWTPTPGTTLRLPARVNGMSCHALLDSGAEITFISPALGKQCNARSDNNVSMTGVMPSGHQVHTSSFASVDITLGDFQFLRRVPVFPTPRGVDLMIGIDSLREHHFSIDFGRGRVSARGIDILSPPEPAGKPSLPAASARGSPSAVSSPCPTPPTGSSPPKAGPEPRALGGTGDRGQPQGGKTLVQGPSRGKPSQSDAEVQLNFISFSSFRRQSDAAAFEDVISLFPLHQPCQVLLGSLQAHLSSLSAEDAKVLSAFDDIFSEELVSLPPLRSTNFSVELTDASPPPHRPPYPMSPEKKEALQHIINNMLNSGLIRRHFGKASCPIFLVKKRSLPGQPQRWRAVLDARPVNARTASRPFAAPRVDEVLPRLRNAKVMSQIDATSAFYQVRMSPGQEDLFTFADPHGARYALRVMPMGATNAMATLHDVVSDIFADLISEGSMVVYADDWVLLSGSTNEHRQLLRRFFQRCRKHKLVLHPSKSRFFVNTVDFLGFHVSNGQVSATADKTQAFRDWPRPKTITDIRAFLGAANYYAHLIPRFRCLAAPLDELTGRKASLSGKRTDQPFRWDEEQQRSFEALRDALVSAPVLALPDLLCKHFHLVADASVDGLGAVLEQEQPDGQRRPVAYFCRRTTDAERNMDIRTLELLAVVSCLDKYEVWLGGATVDVWTDHQSLLYLATTCPVSRRLVRCLDTLQQHKLRWHYRPGSSNTLADALSRRADFVGQRPQADTTLFQRYLESAHAEASGLPAPSVTPISPSAFEEHHDGPRRSDDYPLSLLGAFETLQSEAGVTKLLPSSEMAALLRDGYKQDSFFQPILQALQDGVPSSPLDAHDRFYLADSLIYRHHPIHGPQLCIPNGEGLNRILATAHDDTGHPGVKKTVSAMEGVYFPGLRRHVERYIRGCRECQRAKATHNPTQGHLMPLPVPSRPWTDISLDIVSGFPEAYGKNAILTIVDRRTKSIRAIPIRTHDGESSSETIVDALLEHVYQYTGPFFNILSDRGPQFTSTLFRNVMDRFGVNMQLTSAYHPETDGQTERYNKVIAEALRATLCNGDHAHWPDVLPFIVYNINSTVHRALGCSPYEADFARNPLQWWDVRRAHEPMEISDNPRQLRQAVDRMVTEALEEAQTQYKRYANAKRILAPVFKAGDRVLVRASVLKSKEEMDITGYASKLRSKFIGPFKVVERINSNAYRIELPHSLQRAHNVINVSNLRPYNAGSDYGRADEPPPLWVSDDGEFYQPKDILKHRTARIRGKITPIFQYLVSWVGFGPEDNRWLSLDDLKLCPDLIREYWQQRSQAPPPGSIP